MLQGLVLKWSWSWKRSYSLPKFHCVAPYGLVSLRDLGCPMSQGFKSPTPLWLEISGLGSWGLWPVGQPRQVRSCLSHIVLWRVRHPGR